MKVFKYGNTEKQYLSMADKTMGELIERLGEIERAVEPDIFSALISSIISQQISTKAAQTVKSRLDQLTGGVSVETLSRLTLEEIQGCGMSLRKAEYIRGAAVAAADGTIDFDSLQRMSDKDVTEVLTNLRGVGVWTAEMMLIFSLQRPDVLSFLDLGIRRGIMRAYGLSELSKSEFEILKNRYSPYGSVASLYLWKLAGMDDWKL